MDRREVAPGALGQVAAVRPCAPNKRIIDSPTRSASLWPRRLQVMRDTLGSQPII